MGGKNPLGFLDLCVDISVCGRGGRGGGKEGVFHGAVGHLVFMMRVLQNSRTFRKCSYNNSTKKDQRSSASLSKSDCSGCYIFYFSSMEHYYLIFLTKMNTKQSQDNLMWKKSVFALCCRIFLAN